MSLDKAAQPKQGEKTDRKQAAWKHYEFCPAEAVMAQRLPVLVAPINNYDIISFPLPSVIVLSHSREGISSSPVGNASSHGANVLRAFSAVKQFPVGLGFGGKVGRRKLCEHHIGKRVLGTHLFCSKDMW